MKERSLEQAFQPVDMTDKDKKKTVEQIILETGHGFYDPHGKRYEEHRKPKKGA